MVTDAQFVEWLKDEASEKTIFAKLAYRATGGTLEYEWVASRGVVTSPTDSNMPNYSILGVLDQDMEIPTSLSGFSGASDLEVRNDNGELDQWISRLWYGQPVVIYIGDATWDTSDYRELARVKNGGIAKVGSAEILFSLQDNRELLSRQTDSILTQANQYIPFVIGTVTNVSPVLVDAQTLTYRVHTRPVGSITVRDNGVPISVTTDPENATFTLINAPAGQLTADVTAGGTTPEFFVQLVAAEMSDVLTGYSAASLPGYQIGWVAYSPVEWSKLLDDVLTPINIAWWVSPTGVLECTHTLPPEQTSGTAAFLSENNILDGSLDLDRVDPLVGKVVVNYKRRWAVQDAASLAGSLSADTRAFYSTEFDSTEQVTNTDWEEYGETLEFDTPLVNDADAAVFLSELLSIHSVMRYRYTLEAQPLSPVIAGSNTGLGPGAVISVPGGQLLLSDQDKLRVTGVTQKLGSHTVELELWK